MKVLVGLGNPGEQYAETPHNLGFKAIDAVASALGAEWKTEKRFKALVAKATRKGEALWLVKPQTYMNLSGESVGPFLRYYGATAGDLLVLSDDCDLPAGRLRIRPSGSAGGHNGLKSLIAHLGTEAFARIRLGAGRSPEERRGLIDFVLHRFTEAEAEVAAETASVAAEAVFYWLDHGLQAAQNQFNAVRTTNNQEKL
ncbi:MAG: aminoacyl-tRNA hydrolase [Kiritimatiellae bacterium]|nr:aminoacyl-tRNA hydrolase [Kiritimatiellia bacterium]